MGDVTNRNGSGVGRICRCVVCCSSVLCTESYHWMLRIWCWQVIWNDWRRFSSIFLGIHVSALFINTLIKRIEWTNCFYFYNTWTPQFLVFDTYFKYNLSMTDFVGTKTKIEKIFSFGIQKIWTFYLLINLHKNSVIKSFDVYN